MKPEIMSEDIQRFIDLLIARANEIRANEARANEGTTTVSEQRGEDGTKELFLTIENTVEDRVRAYTRLLRKNQVLRKSRSR
jgi:ribosomal protein L17